MKFVGCFLSQTCTVRSLTQSTWKHAISAFQQHAINDTERSSLTHKHAHIQSPPDFPTFNIQAVPEANTN